MERDPIWYEFRNSVYLRNYDRSEELLAVRPDLISMRNGLGETALHFLSVENDLEGVAWLFQKGADLDSKNSFGEPVLFEVAQLGYKELLTWFNENGANFKIQGRHGEHITQFLISVRKNEMAEWVQNNFT